MVQTNASTHTSITHNNNTYASVPIHSKDREVVIHSVYDEEIDRVSYDADLYDGRNDGASIHLTKSHQNPANINSLSTFKIQQVMDDILTRDTTIHSFTKADLNAHSSSHWTFRIQVDSGASDCIAQDRHILKHYRTVKPRAITIAEKGSNTCIIVGEGYLDLQNDAGDWLTVKALHIPKAVGTIVSPTFMALENPNVTSWDQITHTDTKIAELIFYHRHEYRKDMRFHLRHHNNCWYIHQGYLDTLDEQKAVDPFNSHRHNFLI